MSGRKERQKAPMTNRFIGAFLCLTLSKPWYHASRRTVVLARKLQMQAPIAIIATVALFLALGSRERLETRDSFEFEPAAQQVRRIRWPKKSIPVAFSTSLLAPGAN